MRWTICLLPLLVCISLYVLLHLYSLDIRHNMQVLNADDRLLLSMSTSIAVNQGKPSVIFHTLQLIRRLSDLQLGSSCIGTPHTVNSSKD